MRDAGCRMQDGERGSVTILAVAVIALLLMLVPVIVDIGLFLNARAQAENAADAASLAAAQEFFFEGDCEQSASAYARANGAKLVDLVVYPDAVVAKTEIRPKTIFVSRLGVTPSSVNGLGKAEIKFVKPVNGPIILRFGERYWDEGAGKRRTHCGIDIAADENSPVRASAEGKVFFVGFTPSGGLTISIRHPNGIKTTYLQLKKVNVAQGEGVSSGEIIGTVAKTGDKSSSSTHLHMGALFADQYIDPEKLFSGEFQLDLSRYIRRGNIPPGSTSVLGHWKAASSSWWDYLKMWFVKLWQTLFGEFIPSTKDFVLRQLLWLLEGGGKFLSRLIYIAQGRIFSTTLSIDQLARLSAGASACPTVFDPSGDQGEGPRSKTFISLKGGGGAKAVAVYDGRGRLLRELSGWVPPARGIYWDGLDERGRIAEEGIYTVVVVPANSEAKGCQVEVRYHLK